MAVKQEGAPQQPPGAAQQERTPNSASNTQPVTSNQAQSQAPATQQPAGTPTSAGGQAPSPALDFSQLFEQQIAHAIQPVLDEFQQQVTEAIKHQPAAVPTTGAGGQGARQAIPQGQGAQPVGGQQPAAPAPAPPAAGQLLGQVAQQPPVTGALAPALQFAEQQGEQWLQSWLATGLTVLLAESSRAFIQQRAEHGLHVLLQKLFEAVPDGVSNQEIQAKTEATLQAILQEALGAVFSEAMRATLLQEGEQAIRGALHGDFGAALKMVEDTLKAMAEALVAVLRQQLQRVLRLLLALVLLALESSLAQSDKGK